MPLRLEIAGKLPTGIRRKLLEAALAEIAAQIKSQNGTINLKLVDDAELRALNKKYSGNDKATDVLSFSYIEGGSEPTGGELGDIAISTETAARQATVAATSLETEVVLLLIHGTLHVFGFDHASPGDLATMEALQSAIMTSLNLTYRNFAWDSSKA